MFQELTDDLLDLSATAKGYRGAMYANTEDSPNCSSSTFCSILICCFICSICF